MKEIFRKTIFAHRGFYNNVDVPENSLRAFELAVERGYGIELDVHLLRDGSLVVFHDSDLKRMTGAVGTLEELDLKSVRALRLLGTEHTIPTLDEVLSLTEGKVPAILEIKTKGNTQALMAAFMERMDRYTGDYVMESFDPYAVYLMKKERPQVTRGLLTQDFREEPKAPAFPLNILLSHQVFDFLLDPDFIAARWEDRNFGPIRRQYTKKKRIKVFWTIRSREDLTCCLEEEGGIPIFDSFDPEETEV